LIIFFVGKTTGNQELNLAAKERTFAFYAFNRTHSFQSMDCALPEVQKLFEQEFTYPRIRVRATVIDVLAPPSITQISEKLEYAKFI
jgi:hypothetical protein